MPILGLYPGNVYWVDSGGGGGSKGTFKSPVATLAEGLALCTANNGDYVMVKPNHAETITGAGGITLDKAGVSVIGMGHYNARPTFLMDGATTVTCLVTAANCAMYNLLFKAGHSDITVFGTITAKGFICDSCQWTDNAASENFIGIWNVSAADNDADGLQLLNNTFDSRSDGATLTPFNLLKDTRDVKIIGNVFQGDFDSGAFACIYSVDTEHHYNIEIAYNKIFNDHTANACLCISVGSTTSTGFMHNNMASGKEATGSTPFLSPAGGIRCINNLYSGDDSVSGYLLPPIGAN
jgi:hypothetical protein